MTAKSVLKVIGFIFALIVSSIVILVLLVDANMFKPRIEALAKEYGVTLSMGGDMSWAFWPSIGFNVKGISVASNDAPNAPIADIKNASLLVAFMPLMQGDIQVKHVLIDGASVKLVVDDKGVANWESFTKQKKPVPAEEKPKNNTKVSSEDLKLSIEKIGLEHSELVYTDMQKDQKITIKNLAVAMNNVNLQGKPFDVDVKVDTSVGAAKTQGNQISINTQFRTSMTLGEGFNTVALNQGELKLAIQAKDSATIAMTFSVMLEEINTNLHYKGDFSLPAVDAKKLLGALGSSPTMANPQALTKLSVASEFQGNKQQIALKNIRLGLDKTQITGSLSLTDFTRQAIVANLQGDEINLDDYLAPPTEAKTETTAPSATGNEVVIPLPLIKKLNLDVKTGFKKFIASQLHFENVQLGVESKQGLLQQKLAANMYAGSIKETVHLDARGQTAVLQLDTALKDVDVAQILKAKQLDKSVQLTGNIQLNANGQTTGVTTNQLMDALKANITFEGVKMRVAPFNIEQQFCKFVNMVSRSEEPVQEWPTFTELRELSGRATIADRIIKVDGINAGVEKLTIGTQGTISLVNGSYDFVLPLSLKRDATDTPESIATSVKGCVVGSNYWAERSMSMLRCKGQYTEINPVKDCRPDKDMLNAIIKDFAEYKLKEKHGAKIEEKKAELRKKLDEKLGGEEKVQQAKDTLKNLFKNKND